MNRRDFLKRSYYAGAGVILIRYASPSVAQAFANQGQATLANQSLAGRQLYEGPLKATGAKIYAIDFRAKDMPGWPHQERRGIVLRANETERKLIRIDQAGLRQALGPHRLVTGDDLHRWGCRGAAPFLMPDLYVRSEQAPFYHGQPLALITLPGTEHYLAVKQKQYSLSKFVEWGEKSTPVTRPPYGESHFVYYQGSGKSPEFSFMKDSSDLMTKENGDADTSKNKLKDRYIQKIQQEIRRSDWLTLHQTFQTQSVDPVFLEPENGLSWYDSKSKTLSLTIGTQSPHEDAEAILAFFGNAQTPKIEKIIIHCCFLGGGFGGKDSSEFPLHLAIAAVSEPDVSHRIVYTRAQQFQAGLKRHASQSSIELAIDQQGQFQSLSTRISLDGGGQNNYSFAIQSVGARNAGGAYHFPRAEIHAVANASTGIPAGSMRGFGSFQTSFALECLIDQAASALKKDAIDLRLQNCLIGEGYLPTGVQLAIPAHAHKVLNAAKGSRLWQNRSQNRGKSRDEDLISGIGFAAGFKTFGKNENGCLASVELTEEGKLKLYTPGVDMGNGSATTLSLTLQEILGKPADEVNIGVTNEFEKLKLFSTIATSELEQKKLSSNPFWTPSIVISTAASTSAYHLRHAVLEAAKIILQFGIWPSAVNLLGLDGERTGFNLKNFKLDTNGLHYKDGRTITIKELAQAAYAQKHVTGAMIHAYYREHWASASFKLSESVYESEIDALSIRLGHDAYHPIPRMSVHYSSLRSLDGDANRMTSYAAIVKVEINRKNGKVRVIDADTYLDCGPCIQQEIVKGQMQGAFAMGIGQTLTESLDIPSSQSSPEDLNLHVYHVPTAMDCAIGSATFNILPPEPGDEPRGMSEVVFNPIPAAIVNAIADAIDYRFTRLPVKPADILAVLS